MSNDTLKIQVLGHLHCVDDLGTVLIDKCNSVHPENMSRVFARALANESNFFINRIAFGNGGTTVDAAFTVTYKTPNDGQYPDASDINADPNNGWTSRLYHETYSEIVNAGQTVLNPLLGTDPGSADINTGVRTGGGQDPLLGDPPSVPHVSGPGVRSTELGLTSEVVITAVLNRNEPRTQFLSDSTAPTNQTTAAGDFIFDEIGLYTSGTQAINTNGYQYIDVANKTSVDVWLDGVSTGQTFGQTYSFDVSVDGGASTTVTFTTPLTGGTGPTSQILYGDLCQAINTGAVNWGLSGVNPLPGNAKMSITDLTGGIYPSITAATTFGYLRVQSGISGTSSAVSLAGSNTNTFLTKLNPPTGASLITAVPGTSAGIANDPTNPTNERERLLTHLTFSPVVKTQNREIIITYTLTISVARSPSY